MEHNQIATQAASMNMNTDSKLVVYERCVPSLSIRQRQFGRSGNGSSVLLLFILDNIALSLASGKWPYASCHRSVVSLQFVWLLQHYALLIPESYDAIKCSCLYSHGSHLIGDFFPRFHTISPKFIDNQCKQNALFTRTKCSIAFETLNASQISDAASNRNVAVGLKIFRKTL